VRAAIPRTNPLANCEFAALRERLIKIGARHRAHPPGGSVVQSRRARSAAIRPMSRGATCPPNDPPTQAHQP
jgi:hypothetical protein